VVSGTRLLSQRRAAAPVDFNTAPLQWAQVSVAPPPAWTALAALADEDIQDIGVFR